MSSKTEIFAMGAAEDLCRPCVDCGLYTRNFCKGHEMLLTGCFAKERIPAKEWCSGQLTPLCSDCEMRMGLCYFCRGMPSCRRPFAYGRKQTPEGCNE